MGILLDRRVATVRVGPGAESAILDRENNRRRRDAVDSTRRRWRGPTRENTHQPREQARWFDRRRKRPRLYQLRAPRHESARPRGGGLPRQPSTAFEREHLS